MSGQGADALKRAVAYKAAELVGDGETIGLGSGTTLEFFYDALSERIRAEGLRIACVPTSYQARFAAHERGIPIIDPLEAQQIDLAVDGADEMDPHGNLIKGGGAAHVLEKIVAAAARRFVVLVDESKQVARLGEKMAVPVEVLPPALPLALRRLAALGGRPALRAAGGKLGPVISDSGHPVVDVRFASIADPAALDQAINGIPGVVGHGLFIGMADRALIGRGPAERASVETIEFRRR